jgi:hypothetical protein
MMGTKRMLKMTVFWDVAPCSLTEVYERFRDLAASINKEMIA